MVARPSEPVRTVALSRANVDSLPLVGSRSGSSMMSALDDPLRVICRPDPGW